MLAYPFPSELRHARAAASWRRTDSDALACGASRGSGGSSLADAASLTAEDEDVGPACGCCDVPGATRWAALSHTE